MFIVQTLRCSVLTIALLVPVYGQVSPRQVGCDNYKAFTRPTVTEGATRLQNGSAIRSQPDAETMRIQTDLVVLDFDVRDKKGIPVTTLKASDFRVEEDGVAQSIELFSFGQESQFRRRIILIIDHSQSQIPYLETSIDAAKMLVDLLAPTDEMAIVSDDIMLISDFTSDRQLLKKSLDELRIKALSGNFGKSKQLSALFASLKQLFSDADRRPFVIFQTDGDQFSEFPRVGSSLYRDCSVFPETISDLEIQIGTTQATVYSIIPGMKHEKKSKDRFENATFELRSIENSMPVAKRPANDFRNKGYPRSFLVQWLKARTRNSLAVERITSLSGGTTHYLSAPEDADSIYRGILGEMNRRYLIGYYPLNTQYDGTPRKIQISLRSGLNYKVTGKNSYIPRDR